MLDNFSISVLKEAVKIKTGKVKFEVSGNVNLKNIGRKALPGIDYISVGAITHSFPAMDYSLNLKP
jgi:nicotinate-nucleotide pyrophosphorylase (carboxylating)